ncbi:MAG: ParA family protein [Thermofilaceae archaeon]
MSSEAKSISFISASGGVGKTTLSIYLAKWLIESRHSLSTRLLLIDLDPTAGLSLSLMSEEEYQERVDKRITLSDLFFWDYKKGLGKRANEYSRPIKHGGHELNIIVPGEELDLVAAELWRYGTPGPDFRKALQNTGIFKLYDYVIFDSAPFFDIRYTVLSLFSASKHVIVLRPSPVDFRRTARMLKRIMEYANAFNLETHEFLRKFIVVFNLARQQTRETDTLIDLGFRGISRGRTGKSEEHENFKEYVSELKRLIKVSEWLIPTKAELARLELDRGTKEVLKGVLGDLVDHLRS